MKQKILYLALGALMSVTSLTHGMQVTRTAPRFLNEPSFVTVIRKLFMPAFTRLSNPQGAANIAGNPTSFAPVPFWFQTPNGNAKLGVSVATGVAAATVITLLIAWYLIDNHYSKPSRIRSVGDTVVNTGFTTAKRCLFVMGNALLFGVSFWVLESCLLYTLEKTFGLSVNNPQMYNILLTVLAASFYVMITQAVKEKWKVKLPKTISAPRPVAKPQEAFHATWEKGAKEVPELRGEAPTALQDFLADGEHPEALDQLTQPILIKGKAGSGKTQLVDDIRTKANKYCDLPVSNVLLSRCKTTDDAYNFIAQAMVQASKEAYHRGKDKALLIIDDIDKTRNEQFIHGLFENLRNTQENPIKIIVIATATRDDVMREWQHKFAVCQLENSNNPAEQDTPRRSISFGGSTIQQELAPELHTTQVPVSSSALITDGSQETGEDFLQTREKNMQSSSSSSSSAT